MNKDAKQKIYYAHIYPHLSYANAVYRGYVTHKQKKNTEILY